MAIDLKHINDTYEGRDIVNAKIKLWTRAVRGEFDEGKFKGFGETLKKNKEREGPEDEMLMRFERETNHSYAERLMLMTNPGITEMVAADYTDTFNAVTKTVEIKGLDEIVLQKILLDFDGNGNTVQDFMNQAFDEMIRTDKIFGVTDTTDATSEEEDVSRKIFFPSGHIVPREDVLNFHQSGGGFDFLTWSSLNTKADGITVLAKKSIIIFTREELAIAVEAGDDWVIEKTVPNNLGVAPVRTIDLNGGRSLVHSLANIEFNLFNLDSEQRRFLRNVVAMNFLVIQKSFYEQYKTPEGKLLFDMMSMMTSEKDGGEIKWVGYPEGSLKPFDEYWDRRLQLAMMVSRQRQQKRMAETEKSKALDFSQPDAVLNAAANKIEMFLTKMIDDMGRRMQRNLQIEVHIDRDFHPERIKETLEILEMMMGMGFGKTFEDFNKMEFVRKHNLSPERLKKINEEIEAQEGVKEFFSTTNLDKGANEDD